MDSAKRDRRTPSEGVWTLKKGLPTPKKSLRTPKKGLRTLKRSLPTPSEGLPRLSKCLRTLPKSIGRASGIEPRDRDHIQQASMRKKCANPIYKSVEVR